MTDFLRCDVTGGVATLTLHRPDKLNAMHRAMRRELAGCLTALDEDEAVRAYVVTGAGRAFCVGHDVKEPPAGADEEPVADFLDLFRSLRKPSVAAVNGACMAGGASLALGCDIRFAAPEASFGWPQPKLGLVSVSGPCLVARMLPSGVALRHLLTGRAMDASTAARWGLVEDVVPADELLAVAQECAREIAACAPLAVEAIRRSVLDGYELSLAENIRSTQQSAEKVARSDDAAEGLAAFKEKREPRWSGR
ncbi:enoyl-CoA hydratase/isomerase family protein [Kribbella sp. NPDC049227]|uniref:enoyl-CoA hydratase/isomerase family protein n=1 Tax=Kribbella sp. NPDC049227 TaxID=3364113 RepID=UPI00371FC2C4